MTGETPWKYGPNDVGDAASANLDIHTEQLLEAVGEAWQNSNAATPLDERTKFELRDIQPLTDADDGRYAFAVTRFIGHTPGTTVRGIAHRSGGEWEIEFNAGRSVAEKLESLWESVTTVFERSSTQSQTER